MQLVVDVGIVYGTMAATVTFVVVEEVVVTGHLLASISSLTNDSAYWFHKYSRYSQHSSSQQKENKQS